MTLEQLRIFVAVATREHVTQAAAELNLSQSAVSAAVAALEQRHDVKLFDRLGRRIILTAAGRSFFGVAKAVLANALAAEQALADLAGLKAGALSLAASQTIGNYWLPPRLNHFAKRYPGVSATLRIGNTREVAAMVGCGDVDLGFVEGEVADPTLFVRTIGEDELVVVGPPNHPRPTDRPNAEWLSDQPWVAREKELGTRAAFEAALETFGVKPHERRITLELPSNEAVRSAVEAGAGLTVMSKLVVCASIKAGSLTAMSLALPRRRLFLLRRRDRYVSQASLAFTQIAETYQ